MEKNPCTGLVRPCTGELVQACSGPCTGCLYGPLVQAACSSPLFEPLVRAACSRWLPDGSRMPSRWLLDGFRTAPGWLLDSSRMASGWLPDGSWMVPGWLPDGFRTVRGLGLPGPRALEQAGFVNARLYSACTALVRGLYGPKSTSRPFWVSTDSGWPLDGPRMAPGWLSGIHGFLVAPGGGSRRGLFKPLVHLACTRRLFKPCTGILFKSL